MDKREITREKILNHISRFPRLEIQDLRKFIYQSSYGPEHMISDEKRALAYIEEEFKSLDSIGIMDEDFLVDLDGDYVRVSLGFMTNGLKAETLTKLFVLSSEHISDDYSILEEKIDVLREMISSGEIDFSIEEFDKEIKKWKDEGYQACHHSEVFRKEYKPAYRLVKREYARLLPLLCEIDSRCDMARTTPYRVAIEGGSASGKTTLSAFLEKVYDCTVFHMDDFFLQPAQRTKERLAEAGGNVDRERFLEEVLTPLCKGEKVKYRRYDCSTGRILEGEIIEPKNLVIVEGAYSMHPDLRDKYDASAFVMISDEKQRERIIKRNGDMAERFFNEWIPMERKYFTTFKIKENCDYII